MAAESVARDDCRKRFHRAGLWFLPIDNPQNRRKLETIVLHAAWCMQISVRAGVGDSMPVSPQVNRAPTCRANACGRQPWYLRCLMTRDRTSIRVGGVYSLREQPRHTVCRNGSGEAEEGGVETRDRAGPSLRQN
jgi:hypothetical protein